MKVNRCTYVALLVRVVWGGLMRFVFVLRGRGLVSESCLVGLTKAAATIESAHCKPFAKVTAWIVCES